MSQKLMFIKGYEPLDEIIGIQRSPLINTSLRYEEEISTNKFKAKESNNLIKH